MAGASNNQGEIEAIIARTALKYDLLPYESKPFAQSQPSRLAGIANLFDLKTTPLANARVLELGCASGGNIIPLAVNYPTARFVGVDLARTQVAAGRARIERLGCENIEILCQSFTEISDELGEFDYIICHGVYSWVPEAVQDAIFKVIRARLSATGVACVSYNVLPGWRMLQPLRDAFLLQVPDSVNSLARVAQARELLSFMKESSPDKGPYGDMLRAWADRLAQLPDDYIAHEFLEECNSPSTVRDFTGSAAKHGLGYLGECELSSMILENFGADVAQRLRARSGDNLVETEQYLDILSGRTFRQSILIGQERMDQVNRHLSPSRIEAMHFAPMLGMGSEVQGGNFAFHDGAGRTLTTSSPQVSKGLSAFLSAFPASTTVSDCAKDLDDQGKADLFDAFYRMTLAGILAPMSEPVLATAVISDKPIAALLARQDALEQAHLTTNARHETVALDDLARTILPSLDGKHDHAQLADLLVKAALASRFTFARDDKQITERAEIETVAAELLPTLLKRIADAGLLIG